MMDKFEPASLDVSSAEWQSDELYKVKPTAIRFEKYEMSFAAKVGLGIALRYCNDVGIESIEVRIQWLASRLRAKLHAIDQVKVCDVGARLCGIVSFIVAGVSSDDVHTSLQTVHGISTSVSRITSSRLDFENRGLVDILRASVHYYNTETEIDALVNAVKKIAVSS
jgi:selenocysteine lyase/cysteine desulfurase